MNNQSLEHTDNKVKKINDYVNGILELYGRPLDKALMVLHSQGWTFEKLSTEIFDGEVSRAAIHHRLKKYPKGGEKS